MKHMLKKKNTKLGFLRKRILGASLVVVLFAVLGASSVFAVTKEGDTGASVGTTKSGDIKIVGVSNTGKGSASGNRIGNIGVGSYVTNPYPTDNTSFLNSMKGFLHPGAGEQYVGSGIALDASVTPPSVTKIFLDARSSTGNRPSFFQRAHDTSQSKPSFLASLFDFWVTDGDVFIGLPKGSFNDTVNGSSFSVLNPNPAQQDYKKDERYLWNNSFGSQHNPLSATLQKVNVAGNGGVRSSALTHQYQDPQRVCVDANGVLTLSCPSAPEYQCQGSIPPHASLCSGDNQGLTDNLSYTLTTVCTPEVKCELVCETGFHPENGTCKADVSYHWATGSWGNCSTATQSHCDGSWTTQGSGACVGDGEEVVNYGPNNNANGDDYDIDSCQGYSNQQDCEDFNDYIANGCPNSNASVCKGSCTWDADLTTHQCSDSNPQNQSQCENQNGACHWVDAQGSYHTRSVWCVDNGGHTVYDTYCDASTRPLDSEACDPGIVATYHSIEDACGQGAYDDHRGFERIMTVTGGQPNQVIPYTWETEKGHTGLISFTTSQGVTVNPGTPSVTFGQVSGNVTLDSNGGGIFDLRVCGGVPLNGNSGFTSADFNLQGVGGLYIYGNGADNEGPGGAKGGAI